MTLNRTLNCSEDQRTARHHRRVMPGAGEALIAPNSRRSNALPLSSNAAPQMAVPARIGCVSGSSLSARADERLRSTAFPSADAAP